MGFQGLAAAMAHIHSKGLVDQDWNSGNVLLSLDGASFVKVDLGSAVEVQTAGQPTKSNASCE